MPRAVEIDARVTGPFFQYGDVDVADATREWVEDMLREGQAKVEAQLISSDGQCWASDFNAPPKTRAKRLSTRFKDKSE